MRSLTRATCSEVAEAAAATEVVAGARRGGERGEEVAAVKTKLSSESGQALIETALALPVLLLVLFGIIEFGIALARYQVVTNASREAARAASLFRLNCTDGD